MEYHAPIESALNGKYDDAPAQHVTPFTDILTIYNKDRIPQDHPLMSDRISIGRTDDNEIVLNDKAISRHHTLLERSGDGWWITDMGSTNGVVFGKTRIAAQQAVRWSPNTKVKLGPFELSWKRHLPEAADDRTQIHFPNKHGELEPVQPVHPAQQSSPEFAEVTIKTDRQSVATGESLNVDMTLVNMGAHASEFQIYVDGIPAHWVDIGQGVIYLEPADVQHARFAITIPETDNDARGSHTFEVVIESLIDSRVSASDRASFTIDELHDFELMVRHMTKSDGAMCDVAVMNRGNAADFYSITAASSDDNLRFNARQWQMALTPTTQDHLRISIRPNSQPLVGASRSVPYVITAVSNSGIEKSHYGSVEVPPRLTPQKLGVICLAIVFLSAVIWLALSLLPQAEVASVYNQLAAWFNGATDLSPIAQSVKLPHI